MKHTTLNLVFSVLIAISVYMPLGNADETEFSYEANGKVYRYSVIESGDNFNYEFDKNPGSTNEQLKAGVHVLQSIYSDSSIDLNNRRPYIRERATCSLFKATLYNYTFCIFPNDFSPQKKQRFRGFVTQLPNWKWMIIWNLIPGIVIFSLIYFWMNKKNR